MNFITEDKPETPYITNVRRSPRGTFKPYAMLEWETDDEDSVDYFEVALRQYDGKWPWSGVKTTEHFFMRFWLPSQYGVYFFRVRATNIYGAQGKWSNSARLVM